MKFTMTPKRWLEDQRWTDEYPIPWYEREDISAAVEEELSK